MLTYAANAISDSFLFVPISIHLKYFFCQYLIYTNNTQMRNLCQIFCAKTGKICVVVLIVCLVLGLTPAAESVSVKLRGKIALVGILSGLAYVTHTFVKRDRRAVEKLQLHLGPPDRVIQFERGFDLWRIHYYEEQCYMFRNNRFIRISYYNAPSNSIERLRWKGGSSEKRTEGWKKYASNLPTFQPSNLLPFLIDTPVLVSPKWLQPCLLHPQQAPQLGSSYLYPLGDEDPLRSLSSCSSRRLCLSWWHLRARRYEAPSHPLP